MTANGPAHPAELELFDDTLSCDVVVPVKFEANQSVQRPGTSEMLLRSVAMVEDSRGSEDNDERTESSAQLQRLEARLDLALVLLGRLMQQSIGTLPVHPVRWSRHGLRITLDQASGAQPGTAGVVKLQPAEWLPDTIELPVVVLAELAADQRAYLWLRVHNVGDALASAIERHLFRLHRRQIADSRRNR